MAEPFSITNKTLSIRDGFDVLALKAGDIFAMGRLLQEVDIYRLIDTKQVNFYRSTYLLMRCSHTDGREVNLIQNLPCTAILLLVSKSGL